MTVIQSPVPTTVRMIPKYPHLCQSEFDRFSALDFNVFQVDTQGGIAMICQVFHELDSHHRQQGQGLNLDMVLLQNFTCAIQARYRSNPYHSWTHALGVFQQLYAFFHHSPKLSSYFSGLQIFTMLLAAMCHDVSHPGNDNSFEVAAETELALLYSDRSVLEQFHAAESFRVARLDGCQVLAQFSKSKYGEIRKLFVDAILFTDMRRHFDAVSLMNALANSNMSENLSEYEGVRNLAGSVLHACDVGAQLYPTDIAKKWTSLLIAEFNMQAKKERTRGIDVPAFRDHLDSTQAQGNLQMNFIDYIVGPLWTILIDNMFPELGSWKVHFQANRSMYAQWASSSSCTEEA